jgi:hypothetical protein
VRAYGDRAALSRLPDQLVCVVWALGVFVGDGWQVGLANGVDSHESDYLVSQAEQDRSKVVYL